jgi:hypothetical protein
MLQLGGEVLAYFSRQKDVAEVEPERRSKKTLGYGLSE